MRRIALMALAAMSLGACSNDSTAPDPLDFSLEAGAFGTALTMNGGYDAGLMQERLVNALPDEIKLSDAQKTAIRSLVQAFEAATREDRQALGLILKKAREAAAAGKSRAEIQEILGTGAAYRERLAAAERKLMADIEAVLTAEQRAWIQAHKPTACRPENFPPLSDAQKSAIHALETAFRENNRADLEIMKSVMEEVRAAVRAGSTRDEVAVILRKGAEAASRLATARKQLRDDILGVLTPQQRASRCFPLG
ncbi:MAG: Spy/CpxP family protein refolding chaperone [Gemmatimonadota bacterium]|nr:Spy/CpxP family protein refolding chaperone [Gemmatimonadota bacterium]